MDWPIFMIKTVEQIKEEVDITYAQIERRPEKRKKREKKFLHFLKIPLKKKELCIYYSLLLRLITIVHVAAAVGKNWILSPPSPCLYTIFNVCPLFINNALDGEVHDQKKVGGVKGIKFRGTTQNPEIIVTITLKICSSMYFENYNKTS